MYLNACTVATRRRPRHDPSGIINDPFGSNIRQTVVGQLAHRRRYYAKRITCPVAIRAQRLKEKKNESHGHSRERGRVIKFKCRRAYNSEYE